MPDARATGRIAGGSRPSPGLIAGVPAAAVGLAFAGQSLARLLLGSGGHAAPCGSLKQVVKTAGPRVLPSRDGGRDGRSAVTH
jgi:hypothetical protein